MSVAMTDGNRKKDGQENDSEEFTLSPSCKHSELAISPLPCLLRFLLCLLR